MKTRQGFVSNSSSSSFIVAFPNKKYTKAAMMQELFGSRKAVCYCDEQASTDIITSVVHNDYKQAKKWSVNFSPNTKLAGSAK